MTMDMTKAEIFAFLAERDGYRCTFPGCVRPLGDPNDIDTLDHIYPQFLAKQAGWTRAEIDALDNLQIQHKRCNAIKGHQLPDENGNFIVPVREPKPVRGPRPEICDTCYNGRILFIGEVCPDCESGPQPAAAPSAYKKTPKECSHSGFDHCWMCYLGFVERGSALQNLITGT